MKKQVILSSLGLLGILFFSFTFVFLNPDIRFEILQDAGIKHTPKLIDELYYLEPYTVGIPSPYHMAIIDDDIFFNQRFTGNLFVIKSGEFQENPILEFNNETDSRIIGVDSLESSILIHLIEYNDDKKIIGDKIYQYIWDGNVLDFVKELNVNKIFTDEHHSGGIITNDDRQIFSTFTRDENSNNFEYYAYGIHGLDFDIQTNNIWHTTEVDANIAWPEMIDDVNPQQKQYEKIHILSSDLKNLHKMWEVPYYPNSLVIPETNFSKKWENSVFVGYCKGEKSKGGIYEYPLNKQRTEFLILNSEKNLLEINHSEYIIAENFHCVSDLEISSTGIIYVVDYISNGAIYKIVPKS
jgi:hypothetical protein